MTAQTTSRVTRPCGSARRSQSRSTTPHQACLITTKIVYDGDADVATRLGSECPSLCVHGDAFCGVASGDGRTCGLRVKLFAAGSLQRRQQLPVPDSRGELLERLRPARHWRAGRVDQKDGVTNDLLQVVRSVPAEQGDEYQPRSVAAAVRDHPGRDPSPQGGRDSGRNRGGAGDQACHPGQRATHLEVDLVRRRAAEVPA